MYPSKSFCDKIAVNTNQSLHTTCNLKLKEIAVCLFIANFAIYTYDL